jgi:hypothetical protein
MKLAAVFAVIVMSCSSRSSQHAFVDDQATAAPEAPATTAAPNKPQTIPPAASTVGSTGIVTEPHPTYGSSGEVTGGRDSHGNLYDGRRRPLPPGVTPFEPGTSCLPPGTTHLPDGVHPLPPGVSAYPPGI